VSDVLVVRRRGEPLLGEVVGFEAGEALVVPLGEPTGVGPDDIVEATGESLQVAAGTELLGRVLDGLGRPLDGRPFPAGLASVPVDRAPPPALERPLISEAFATGVRAIDAFTTLGVGQRVGLFAGSGVGKSTLLGSIARGANADAVVVALVGERGREVSEFLEHALGPEGRRRAVVVVATSDAPPIERLRAAQVATALAERLRDLGKKVLLLVDSVTRFARAQREIGLAAGEPPARRGYPPSVFTQLPRLLERSGQAARGSITAIYTVLVEGSDMEEPIADEVRGILDGHIVLDRRLGARGHYPAIDVLSSLSRVMTRVAGQQHIAAAQRVRSLLAAYEEKRDLIALGAYAKGSDAKLDQAIAALPEIERLLRQNADSVASLADSVSLLTSIAERYPERR
jgi:type III secretion protein N (ATPase)